MGGGGGVPYIYIYMLAPLLLTNPGCHGLHFFSHMKSAKHSLLGETCMAHYLRSGLYNRYFSSSKSFSPLDATL